MEISIIDCKWGIASFRLADSVHLIETTSIKVHTNEGKLGKASTNMDISMNRWLLESYGYVKGTFVEWQLGW